MIKYTYIYIHNLCMHLFIIYRIDVYPVLYHSPSRRARIWPAVQEGCRKKRSRVVTGRSSMGHGINKDLYLHLTIYIYTYYKHIYIYMFNNLYSIYRYIASYIYTTDSKWLTVTQGSSPVITIKSAREFSRTPWAGVSLLTSGKQEFFL